MIGIELKPCPFCGGEAVIHVENGVCVICTECKCRTLSLIDGNGNGKIHTGAIESVVERWNTRVLKEDIKKSDVAAGSSRFTRKELDMGKIKALYKAGWSISKIADEMGVSYGTIQNRLEEMKK